MCRLAGGYAGASNTGAAWVFAQSGGVWTRVGSKLVGTGAVGAAEQGISVTLSGDGRRQRTGCRPGRAFRQQRRNGCSPKAAACGPERIEELFGSDNTGAAEQGTAVARCPLTPAPHSSGDGPLDASGHRRGLGLHLRRQARRRHGFNGDGYSDILWRNRSSTPIWRSWEMNGGTILNRTNAGLGGVPTTFAIVGQRDFNGDGNAGILWRDIVRQSGDLGDEQNLGRQIKNTSGLGNGVPTNWSVAGTGDFNGDRQGRRQPAR